jgi:ribosomal protein S18 acetylase RimI-like enzyme
VSRVSVREARSAELRRLAHSTLESLPPEIVSAGGYEPQRTDRLLDADVVFVAELDGHPAGHVAVREEDGALAIDQLVVDEACQGVGVGNRMLDWVEGYALSRGLMRVQIEVEQGNARAEDFYRRRGYACRAGIAERTLP